MPVRAWAWQEAIAKHDAKAGRIIRNPPPPPGLTKNAALIGRVKANAPHLPSPTRYRLAFGRPTGCRFAVVYPPPTNPAMKASLKLLSPVLLSLALGLVARAADAGINGKWNAEFESQVGQQKYVFEFKADGEKVTGQATSERDGQKSVSAIKNGKLVKDEVSFTETLKIQDMDIAVEYKGKIVGDEIKLHRKVGEFAEYDIVAKRVVEKK